MAEWTAQTNLTPREYEAFLEWFNASRLYGEYNIPKNDEDIFSSPVYRRWVTEDKPFWEPPTQKELTPQPITAGTPSDTTTAGEGAGLARTWITEGLYQDAQGLYWDAPTGGNQISQLGAQEIRRLASYDPELELAQQQWSASQAMSQEQLGLEREKFEWQQKLNTATDDPRIKELEFELWRDRKFAELTSPGDWIPKFYLQNMPNPFTQTLADTLQSRTSRGKGVATPSWSATQQPPAMGGTAPIPYATGITREPLSDEERSSAIRRKNIELRREKEAMTLRTPEWLPQFAPSQVAGQPMTQGEVVTPSGQQWAQMPWSLREKLRGYTDWSGQQFFPDILERMAFMQPEPPVGSSRIKWTPARQ